MRITIELEKQMDNIVYNALVSEVSNAGVLTAKITDDIVELLSDQPGVE